MGDDPRLSDVTNAADSITAYVDAIEELRNGTRPRGSTMLDEVAGYNAYDCRSTLRLRDWLLSLRQAAPAAPVQPEELLPPIPSSANRTPSTRRSPRSWRTSTPSTATPTRPRWRSPPRRSTTTAARRRPSGRTTSTASGTRSTTGRTRGTSWWSSGRRSSARLGARCRVPVRSRGEIRLSGTLAPGARDPAWRHAPPRLRRPTPAVGHRSGPRSKGASARAVVLDASENGEAFEVLVKESLPVGGGEPHAEFPVALAPAAPPRAKPQPEAIAEWGQEVLDALPAMLPDPALDLLRRSRRGVRSPPCRATTRCPPWSRRCWGLDRSYLAIQGPPGTGKTTSGRTSSPDSSASTAGASGSSAVARDERELPVVGRPRRGAR